LDRAIPNSHRRDATGCYPIFCCRNWSGLKADLDELRADLVSLVLVTDPFAPVSEKDLNELFDRVIPFKEHFVADLSKPIEKIVSKKRYRLAHKALKTLTVEAAPHPEALVDEWWTLYSSLIHRHKLQGMKALSRSAFARLFTVPGLVVLRASFEGVTVGMHVEFVSGDVVYGHLAAYSDLGYRLHASSALHVWEVEHFAGNALWIDWGGVAGLDPERTDGLTSFKQGFSNQTRRVYLCGRIFDDREYRDLAAKSATGSATYFPSYRAGEFS